MQQLLSLLPALACPVGMGAMMWMMMRPHNGTNARPQLSQQPEGWIDPQQAELASLRAEVDQLRAGIRQQPVKDAELGRVREQVSTR